MKKRARSEWFYRAHAILLAVLCVGLLMMPHEANAEETTDQATLRGYGKVAVSFSDGAVQLLCEDAGKANVVYSKLTADLHADGTQAPKTEILNIGNKQVPVYALANGTFGMLAVDGSSVAIFAAATKDELVKTVTAQMKSRALTFPENATHPMYLDFYDNKALKFYVKPMATFLNFGIESHWEFINRLGLGGLLSQGFSFSHIPAEGVEPFSVYDFELANAKKNDGLLVLCPEVGGPLPLWMYNKNPNNVAKIQDSTLFVGWSVGTVAATFEQYGDRVVAEDSPVLALLKKMILRYRDHQNLGGWQFYRGQPIGDVLGVVMDGCLWDASENAQIALHEWLDKKYSLRQLGERWFHDPDYYSSWEEVCPPQMMDFLGGNYDRDRLLLSSKPCQWRKTPKDAYEQPPADEGAWVDVAFPPSDRMDFLDSGSGYYKIILDNKEWLKDHAAQTLYLKATVSCYDSHRLIVWINGKKVETNRAYSAGVKQIGATIPAGTLHVDGANTLIIQTPDGRSDGRLAGPVSISTLPAMNYPYLDPALNAMYIDLSEFQWDMAALRTDEMIRYARQYDADRPITISGGALPIWSRLFPMFGRNGVGYQSTSTDGFYYPCAPDLADAYGMYFTAEPSQDIADVNKFDRMFGTVFYNGASSTAIFMDVEQYIRFDKQTGHVTKRAPLLKLLGKYLLDQADIAILTSTPAHMLGTPAPWLWNIARGEIQSEHFNCRMISEKELLSGKAVPYKIIIDGGSDVMTEKTVEALRHFVELGGTYIAMPVTGRHTPLEQNAYPVVPLTGFKAGSFNKNGKIRWDENPAMYPFWSDAEFDGCGKAVDWKKNVVTFAGSGLTPEVFGVKTLARWEDGSAAVGLRELGKGKVITLGSSFWRDGADINGKWLPSGKNELLEKLLTGAGAQRQADAGSSKIWIRKAVSKNGLEDWLIAANIAERDPFVVTTDLSIKLDYVPQIVKDAVTGKSLPFTVAENGLVTIAAVTFEKYETRIISFVRPVLLTDAMKTWWHEKAKFWSMIPQPELPQPKEVSGENLACDQWRFLADTTDTVSKDDAWVADGFDDKGWKTMASGSWKLLDPELKDYEGTGLYRMTFFCPPQWDARNVLLNFDDPMKKDNHVAFYINGKKVAYEKPNYHNELTGIKNYDVTDLVDKTGPNVLAVKVDGKNHFTGISMPLWLSGQKRFTQSITLNGQWECVKKDYVTVSPVTLPGNAHGRYIRRTFQVPAEWAGKTVFLRFNSGANRCGSVLVNEKSKAMDYGYSPFPLMAELNVTTLIKPGLENKIELWPRHSIPQNWRGIAYGWPSEATVDFADIEIGYSDNDE